MPLAVVWANHIVISNGDLLVCLQRGWVLA